MLTNIISKILFIFGAIFGLFKQRETIVKQDKVILNQQKAENIKDKYVEKIIDDDNEDVDLNSNLGGNGMFDKYE